MLPLDLTSSPRPEPHGYFVGLLCESLLICILRLRTSYLDPTSRPGPSVTLYHFGPSFTHSLSSGLCLVFVVVNALPVFLSSSFSPSGLCFFSPRYLWYSYDIVSPRRHNTTSLFVGGLESLSLPHCWYSSIEHGKRSQVRLPHRHWVPGTQNKKTHV